MSDRLEKQTQGDVTVIQFKHRTLRDELYIQELAEELYAAVDNLTQLTHPKLLLNFGDVSLLSSGMLGKLILLNRRLSKSGAALKLCGLGQDLAQIFAMTGLTAIFDIQQDQDSALAAFN